GPSRPAATPAAAPTRSSPLPGARRHSGPVATLRSAPVRPRDRPWDHSGQLFGGGFPCALARITLHGDKQPWHPLVRARLGGPVEEKASRRRQHHPRQREQGERETAPLHVQAPYQRRTAGCAGKGVHLPSYHSSSASVAEAGTK